MKTLNFNIERIQPTSEADIYGVELTIKLDKTDTAELIRMSKSGAVDLEIL